ncbi:WecB/TagA/CpsF family glycosyltransferase [Rubrobacter calidifluminis]|uniref:WecB/TagA/CpsF family glycosyltransferase n=1 Tax=Rubrobacter calidifluminis TaxID=1392640 RepID=UPI00235E9AD0|nr:WecB/TagA/CpsF family glycosyltransferase [Rubrobacter calidifluminis]
MTLASRSVIGMRVDAASCDETTRQTSIWAREGHSSYVCVANVHMAMEAFDSASFRRIVNDADLVVPDGRPLVWALRWLGVRGAPQARGADLLVYLVENAARAGIPVGFYGGTPESLEALVRVLGERFPGLEVACAISPPFRELTEQEDEAYVRQIRASGARILFVGLGCPKQEMWMARHRGSIPAVMVGVGAAFDFCSGRIRQAPGLLQKAGLEWAYRLSREPRRLWKRYLKHNPRFAAMLALQILGLRTY